MAAAKKQTKPKADTREAALDAAMASIAKDFGDEVLVRLGDAPRKNVEGYPTGILAYDQALGVGGLAKGRIIEIFGPESSGKTTVALHLTAQTQRQGGTVAFIDAEHALDPQYAAAVGVDVNDLLLSQPDYGEQALEVANRLARSGAVELIVVDSVAALTPKSEIEGESGDQFVGLQARMMSQHLRQIAGNLNRSNTSILFINQLREKIGVKFGSPETTPGGRALKFYASQRLDVRRIETLRTGEEAWGTKVKLKVVKNKVAPPFKVAVATNVFGLGMNREANLVLLAQEHGIIAKSGAWFKYAGEPVGQGFKNTYEFLQETPELADEIELKVKHALGLIDDATLDASLGGPIVVGDGVAVDPATGEKVAAA